MPGNQQQWKEINAAFSKQSSHFDEDDLSNPILQFWRQRIYDHVDLFLKPNSKILEINSGTGIDAVHFAEQDHHVHATDLSDGMVSVLKEKVMRLSLAERISSQQVSFENLNEVQGNFDFVFSNFGGLNCTGDLTKVMRHLPSLLNPNGFVTLVIMPRICPWEWLWLFKGKLAKAFRRLNSNGASSHLEGHQFLTHYFSLKQIKISMGEGFKMTKVESLGCCSPPPAATSFIRKFPSLAKYLNGLDKKLSGKFPFNRWGDHLIVTFHSKQKG